MFKHTHCTLKNNKNPNVTKKKSCCKTAVFGRTKRKEIIICLHVSNLFDMLKKDVVFKKKYKHITRNIGVVKSRKDIINHIK